MARPERPVWKKTLALLLGVQLMVLLVSPSFMPSANAQESLEDRASLEAAGRLELAREHVLAAEYDKAIKVLRDQLGQTENPDILEPTYLLLIQAFVLFSNDFRDRGDFVTSELYLDRAGTSILECLQNPALAHVRPEPEVEFPPEMVALFRDTLARIFGSIQVRVDPQEATVRLDGELLPVPQGAQFHEARNVPVGEHVLTMEAEGFNTLTEQVTILPNTMIAPEYSLKKSRGFLWYASRGAVVTAGVVVAAILGSGGGGGDEPVEDLPGPPDPPGN